MPQRPITSQTSCMVALAAGNTMVRISGVPFGFIRLVPSASTTWTWAPSQLAWREPLAKSQRAVIAVAAGNRLHLVRRSRPRRGCRSAC